ncbi:unnamed protein product [Rotaria sp. Silwood2]|nr:unnamed protein product [Rotaria sp. Silwood2]CAF2555739.1 unnamed protein product [Rotaria sp. Silwood2]CAF2818336.1 unnamed protein product [Rotaria sp. Silwood2]CAF2979394.1 unnamed protein product [Rotaria sp. Silwood2]CAF4008832.1 unnamed protein product [Rotaria sp. Silwood2]
MLKKPGNTPKSKLIKNLSSSKPSSVTSSLYSGNANAQRSIKKPGSLHPLRSTQSKTLGERNVIEAAKNPYPPAQYHSWKPEYQQLFTREKIKKSMTKDPYSLRTRTIAHATESITTEEECCLEFIPANAVHIETLNIQEPEKFRVPSIIRYLRSSELLPSEKFVSQTPMKKSSESQLKFETKTTLPTIRTNTTTGTAPTLVTTDRLLNRAKMRIDASVIRRPPRRLIINVTRETLVPLSIYG